MVQREPKKAREAKRMQADTRDHLQCEGQARPHHPD